MVDYQDSRNANQNGDYALSRGIRSLPDENPYLTPLGITGLIYNLIGGGDNQDFARMSEQRLEALSHQAVDVRDSINTQMAALGNVTAWAADSGELNHENVARIGFLTEFLAELQEQAIFIQSEADSQLAKRRRQQSEHPGNQ